MIDAKDAGLAWGSGWQKNPWVSLQGKKKTRHVLSGNPSIWLHLALQRNSLLRVHLADLEMAAK